MTDDWQLMIKVDIYLLRKGHTVYSAAAQDFFNVPGHPWAIPKDDAIKMLRSAIHLAIENATEAINGKES